MNAVVDQLFHAPADTDLVDRLVAERNAQVERCRQLVGFITEGYADATSFFFKANEIRFDRYSKTTAEIFNLETVVPYIDSVYWQNALEQTDVYECMPQARKDQWREQIQERSVPEFTDENVRATIGDLLLSRAKFLAEKADGLFRRLSKEHVTNAPEGFGRRFILANCFSWGSATCSSAGYLGDLREIVAKFMNRPLPEGRLLNHSVMEFARNCRRGKWVDLDGGALRIRCFKIGTTHIEVHPDVSWRLNQLLHTLYPAAIPSRFRNPPKRKPSLPAVHDRLLSFECLQVLESGIKGYGEKSWSTYGSFSKAARQEAESVLQQLGGIKRAGLFWEFDYSPRDALQEIVASGVVPDQVAHQFYPTPEDIGEAMLAECAPGSSADTRWLEPSAGTGSLADLILEKTGGKPVCVEISPIHAQVLTSKGHEVTTADFIEWANAQAGSKRFQRILMNPPYSEGRALAHLEAARPLLAPGGRLVALLPASFQGKDLPGRWGATFDRFPGTSISVSIYIEDAPTCAAV